MHESRIPIEVRSRTDAMESVVRDFAEQRMSFALDRLRNLRRTVISIEDVNGPKGGVDKHCRVLAEFGFAHIIIEETQASWQSAVARAIRRLARCASLKLHQVNRSTPHGANRRPRKIFCTEGEGSGI